MFLKYDVESSNKAWVIDVMKCVEELGKGEFSLKKLYAFENKLGLLHRDNLHIRDKIRQQFHILRHNGFLEYISRGKYRLLE